MYHKKYFLALILLGKFSIAISQSIQLSIDTNNIVNKFDSLLNSFSNYRLLTEYFCGDLHIDCGCYKNKHTSIYKKDWMVFETDYLCNDSKFGYRFSFLHNISSNKILVKDRKKNKIFNIKKWNKKKLIL